MTDFNMLTVGMITGFITQYNNDHLGEEDKEDGVRMATQDDFDRW
ncbi:hypothetical protein [Desulfitobacterium hafniense]|nr:hypothetical protein [Desulfitobacterium hafniense]